MARYKQYVGNGTCIVVSSYAGKTVKGVAKVAPNDEFDLEKGFALAKARCDQKVAEKRMKNARKRYENAELLLDAVKDHYIHMANYCADACDEYVAASDAVDDLLKTM